MHQFFTIADITLSLTLPDGLAAWTTLAPRFAPFAAEGDAKPAVEIRVSVGTLSDCDAEEIYEPDHAGIGFVTSRVLRQADGSTVLEFRHADAPAPRMWLVFAQGLDKATVVLAPDGDANDSYFLTHALMLTYMMAACRVGTLMIHASAVVLNGKAYLFQGRSGTGKSTHARMWLENIPGTEQLNDDNPIVGFAPDGTAMAYGSPWSGKSHCYRNVEVPVGAFVRIVRAKENSLRRLAPLKAYASLTTSMLSMPFLGDELWAKRHATIERLASTVECCEMHCLPNADAAIVCKDSLTKQ